MDKIDKLLDVIEHTERYSDDELSAMLADHDVREVYEMLNKSKASLTPISTPDVDAEWKKFENAHNKRSFHILNIFSRKAAASIAIGIASLAAVAAVVGVSMNYDLDKKDTQIVTEAKDNVVNDTINIAAEIPEEAPEIIVFDNEPLETIVNHIADYYRYNAEFSTDAPKSLRLYFRWNQAQTLDDVVESLNNFERIHLTIEDKSIIID